MTGFSIARLPRIEFGRGTISKLPEVIACYGKRILLVTGARSFQQGTHWTRLQAQLRERNIEWEHCTVNGEPSPNLVDDAAATHKAEGIDVVVGIGGGSVLDAAKAIAGLLRTHHSVMDYLEGVGPELPYQGPVAPFIAIPTTAGTGSEATKNAVLSVPGREGFKKSFRDEALVARYAMVDPELLTSCPGHIIAANGMDALTQLIESYVSLKANPVTDALAESGMAAVREGLLDWYGQTHNIKAAEHMAYAALVSGITLAQTGLGSVHGLASPLGAFFPIPHGAACGTLVAQATGMNISAMHKREPDNPALGKYARVAGILCGKHFTDASEARQQLVELLTEWTKKLNLPSLSTYGVTAEDVDHIVAHSRGSSIKTNPIGLDDGELSEVLLRRL